MVQAGTRRPARLAFAWGRAARLSFAAAGPAGGRPLSKVNRGAVSLRSAGSMLVYAEPIARPFPMLNRWRRAASETPVPDPALPVGREPERAAADRAEAALMVAVGQGDRERALPDLY